MTILLVNIEEIKSGHEGVIKADEYELLNHGKPEGYELASSIRPEVWIELLQEAYALKPWETL